MLEKKSAISEICQNTIPNSLSSMITQDETGSRTQSAASGDAQEEQVQPGQQGPNRHWEQKQNQKHQESPADSI